MLGLSGCERESRGSGPSPNYPGRISPELAGEAASIEAAEQRINETAWAREMLADECGRTVEAFWDALNAATNKLHLAAAFPLPELVLGRWETSRRLPPGITVWESSASGAVLSAAEWPCFVESFERAGWRLVQTEFRHNQFETDSNGRPHQSRFFFSAHLVNLKTSSRSIVEGDLMIEWQAKTLNEPAAIKRVDASRLQLKTRRGAPPFELLLNEQTLPARNAYSIGPLLVYDLGGDGLSEIILASQNLVYERGADGQYRMRPLCSRPAKAVSSAVIADFDGDGEADFLCDTLEGLVLYSDLRQGTFEGPGRTVWAAPKDVKYSMVLTCGDIDQDGDLDVFMGQYKLPYEGGQMPTPYYDANDGYPAYLLRNDGLGNLHDSTLASGLDKKRWRRSFSGSFADLDADGLLELAVVSDFAGVDIYRNEGRARFRDVTRDWIPAPHGFGMGHLIADLNSDGLLDLLMVGMPSPAADRLEHLNLWRPDRREDRRMRREMTRGNRLYIGAGDGGFKETSANASIARSGWSWGCSAFDFNNDGFPDVYIANGMESRESVRDYEREYWLHDIYVADSNEAPAPYLYLQGKVTRLRGRGESYGGYEKNRFYLNEAGASFLEVAHLLGVALELDSRNVVSDDLDGDGRVDLLVTSFERWPDARQTLRVYRNVLSEGGNWIGFRFREQGRGGSAIGAQVTIRHGARNAVRQVITGDSHRSQHASTVHFGLGATDRVERAEIRWANGATLKLSDLPVNRYHSIRMPRDTGSEISSVDRRTR